MLETNLDDLPGEVVGYTMTRLMDGGALDAFVTPIQMKKNRPGVMLSVLCDEPKIPALEEVLFRETTTLGIRRYPVSRHKLKRQAVEVETPFGPVRGKLGWLGDRPPTFSPEYDDCAGSPPSTASRSARSMTRRMRDTRRDRPRRRLERNVRRRSIHDPRSTLTGSDSTRPQNARCRGPSTKEGRERWPRKRGSLSRWPPAFC